MKAADEKKNKAMKSRRAQSQLFSNCCLFLCAILRAAVLSDVEDNVAVCGTVKAFRGVQDSAGGGLGLLAGC